VPEFGAPLWGRETSRRSSVAPSWRAQLLLNARTHTGPNWINATRPLFWLAAAPPTALGMRRGLSLERPAGRPTRHSGPFRATLWPDKKLPRSPPLPARSAAINLSRTPDVAHPSTSNGAERGGVSLPSSAQREPNLAQREPNLAQRDLYAAQCTAALHGVARGALAAPSGARTRKLRAPQAPSVGVRARRFGLTLGRQSRRFRLASIV